MGTETVPNKHIDEMRPYTTVKYLLNGFGQALRAVKDARGQIYAGIELAAKRLTDRKKHKRKGRLIYVGAGTSGRSGVQDGAELWPTFFWPRERVAYLMAGGKRALTRSVEGAEDDAKTARKRAKKLRINERDVVIALSANGAAAFVLEVVRYARKKGAFTIGVANNKNAPLFSVAEHEILLDTGPESPAGSTRMKAGVAQTIFLKIFSTVLMSNYLGYVYKGRMVRMRAVNEKLRNRAVAMVRDLASVSEAEAKKALREGKWDVGVATLIAMGESPSWATKLLFTLSDGKFADAMVLRDLERQTM